MSVLVERDGAVCIVTINRPERRNAVDTETARALFDAFIGFDDDASAAVAILTGASGAFCAGTLPSRNSSATQRSISAHNANIG